MKRKETIKISNEKIHPVSVNCKRWCTILFASRVRGREMMEGKDAHELCLQVEVIQEVSSSKIASAETVTLTMHSSGAFNRRNNYSKGVVSNPFWWPVPELTVSARTENITITFLLVATDILDLLLLGSKEYKAIPIFSTTCPFKI